MGLRLFRWALGDISAGKLVRIEQDATLATWEPSMDGAPRLFRPDLELLGDVGDFEVVCDRLAAAGLRA